QYVCGNYCIYRQSIAKTGQLTKDHHKEEKYAEPYPVPLNILENQPAPCHGCQKCDNPQKRKLQGPPFCCQNRKKGNDPCRSGILQPEIFCNITSQTGSDRNFYGQHQNFLRFQPFFSHHMSLLLQFSSLFPFSQIS